MNALLGKLLNAVGIGLVLLSSALFLVAEIHAWWVLAPQGITCENPAFGLMWHMDSLLPMQFRLMSYLAGSGDFRALGFRLPAAGLLTLGLTVAVGTAVHYLEQFLELRHRRRQRGSGPHA